MYVLYPYEAKELGIQGEGIFVGILGHKKYTLNSDVKLRRVRELEARPFYLETLDTDNQQKYVRVLTAYFFNLLREEIQVRIVDDILYYPLYKGDFLYISPNTTPFDVDFALFEDRDVVTESSLAQKYQERYGTFLEFTVISGLPTYNQVMNNYVLDIQTKKSEAAAVASELEERGYYSSSTRDVFEVVADIADSWNLKKLVTPQKIETYQTDSTADIFRKTGIREGILGLREKLITLYPLLEKKEEIRVRGFEFTKWMENSLFSVLLGGVPEYWSYTTFSEDDIRKDFERMVERNELLELVYNQLVYSEGYFKIPCLRQDDVEVFYGRDSSKERIVRRDNIDSVWVEYLTSL